MNIFLVGEVSSGKSSLLNAIAGGIVSNSSVQRETINPEIYKFDDIDTAEISFKKIVKVLESKHITNKKFDRNTSHINEPMLVHDNNGAKITFKSQFNLGKFNIYDFPGLNDSTDDLDVFFGCIKSHIDNCNYLMYVTKIDSAFINKSEVDIFKKIIDMCYDHYKQCGKLIKVCIVVNKFDNLNDVSANCVINDIHDRLKDIIMMTTDMNTENILSSINIFCVSSHRLLISNIIQHKLDIPIPKFFHHELKRILQNTNVIKTKDLVNSIKKCAILSHEHIQFQSDDIDTIPSIDSSSISDDGNDNDWFDLGSNIDNIKYQGDWNNLIDFIKDHNNWLSIVQAEIQIQWLLTKKDTLPPGSIITITAASVGLGVMALGLLCAAPIGTLFAAPGLVGAAAVSNGLAVLGGGSIAAGGMGITGGTAVIGSVGGTIGASIGAGIGTAIEEIKKRIDPTKVSYHFGEI